jgi:hypothetical protein
VCVCVCVMNKVIRKPIIQVFMVLMDRAPSVVCVCCVVSPGIGSVTLIVIQLLPETVCADMQHTRVD